MGALIGTGLISTCVLLVTALFINNQDSLFFAIFAASSVIFLLPYLLMFPAVAILRYKDPDRHRPFKIPGGDRFVIAMSVITRVIIAAGVVLFLWPKIPHAPNEWSYTGPLLGHRRIDARRRRGDAVADGPPAPPDDLAPSVQPVAAPPLSRGDRSRRP